VQFLKTFGNEGISFIQSVLTTNSKGSAKFMDSKYSSILFASEPIPQKGKECFHAFSSFFTASLSDRSIPPAETETPTC
jgi:hypothetical protein